MTDVSLYPWLMPRGDGLRSMRDIAAEVAAHYRLSVDELCGPSRAQRIAHPRQEAMWAMRQVRFSDGTHRFSYPQIGRFFNRDHTTVLHAMAAVERRRALDVSEAA